METARLLLTLEKTLGDIDARTKKTSVDIVKLVKLGEQMASKLDDIKNKVTELEATVTAQATVTQSAETLMTGLSAIIASLRQELADAIANGANQADLDAVLARLTDAENSVEAAKNKLATAITANTPSQN